MKEHIANSMTRDVADCSNVWFVDSGASNYITGYIEWFSDVKNFKKPSFVETCDDHAHPVV